MCGDINGAFAGGIVGTFLNGTTTISNCFNTGDINDPFLGGGICGALAGVFGSTDGDEIININNCYSKSLITGTDSNGIIAPINIFGYTLKQNINVNNCYTLNGVISSDSADPLLTITNSYEPMGTWNDTNASDNLVGGPIPPSLVGEVWTDPSGTTTDTPWILTQNLECP